MQLQTRLANMPLQEGITGVLPLQPFKSNTFYRSSGSTSKSFRAERGRWGPPRLRWVYLHSIILMAACKGQLPSHTAYRCSFWLYDQNFIINANLVISINGQCPVLITPSVNMVMAIYKAPTNWKGL